MRIISSIALTVLVLTLRVGAIPFESLHTHTPVKPKMVITDSGVDLAISGWVMSNTFWDTRQVVGIQGNDLLFYPAPVKRDPNGDDINAHGEVNLLPIETAFKFELRGPDVGCATSEGLIEMIFFGINEETITLPLLFQGYLQLSWPDYLVSFGQQYSPSFFPVVMPNTVGFSYGAPINSFSVSPQLRFMYHTSIGDMLLAASSSFGSSGEGPGFTGGPFGSSPATFRNSLMPVMHAQFIANAGDHLIGAGIDIKRTVPRLETDKGFKTNESLISITALSYFQFNTDHYKGVIKCMLAQNAPDLGMIGGYAVKTIDPLTDKRTYTNIAVGTTFLDVQREGILEPGLFVGILKNLGAGSSIIPSIPDTSVCCSPAPCKSLIVGLGTDVDTLFRIAPALGITSTRWSYVPN